MNILDYIVPLFKDEDESSFIGSAFFIDNYLVTARHVVNSCHVYYLRTGNDYVKLNPYQWFGYGGIPLSSYKWDDVIAYPLEELKSPLKLTLDETDGIDLMQLVCWQQSSRGVQQIECLCHLSPELPSDSKYFSFITNPRITHGSSGCPIFKEGKVYGMIIMGCDKAEIEGEWTASFTKEELEQIRTIKENMCIAIRASAILRYIERMREEIRAFNKIFKHN